MSDLHSILLACGLSEVNIRYSGGSLMSVINYMAETNALAVLPFSVVFAQLKENRITVLPLDIPQPNRSLGILVGIRLKGHRPLTGWHATFPERSKI